MTKTYVEPQAYEDGPAPAITMYEVSSHKIKAVGHDLLTNTLAVTFTRGAGAVYHYPNQTAETFAAFMDAESKGAFFGEHLQSAPFKKFRGDTPAA